MTEGTIIIHIRDPPLQMTDMQNQKDRPGIETIMIIADQTMSVREEDVLTMISRSHEAGTEKNAGKEIQIGKGPGSPRLLGEGAQSLPSVRVPLLRMNLVRRRRKMSRILSSRALVEHISLLLSSE